MDKCSLSNTGCHKCHQRRQRWCDINHSFHRRRHFNNPSVVTRQNVWLWRWSILNEGYSHFTIVMSWLSWYIYDNRILYIGNHPQKKKFTNFANLEAFMNVFLHFLSQVEFLYMRFLELQNFSRKLSQRISKVICENFFCRLFPMYGIISWLSWYIKMLWKVTGYCKK